MNKQTKKVVYKILNNDEQARTDDYYLILKTVQEMTGIPANTSIYSVFSTLKEKGISFESITRARRKWLEEHPEIKKDLKATKKREEEAENYWLEYSNHIPSLY